MVVIADGVVNILDIDKNRDPPSLFSIQDTQRHPEKRALTYKRLRVFFEAMYPDPAPWEWSLPLGLGDQSITG